MIKYLLFISGLFLFTSDLLSQAIYEIKAPNGNEINIHPDSAYLLNTKEKIAFFAIDEANQTRNIIVTKGDTSYWLLSSGFDLSQDYSDFIPFNEGYIFRAGNTWYKTDLSQENTTVFYDNLNPNNSFEYLRIFSTESLNYHVYNLIIEAREKITGDTSILYHTASNGTTIPFGKKLRIVQVHLESVGNLSGSLLIASVYDDMSQTWSEVGVYREFIRNLTRLHTMGQRNQYNINFVTLLGNKYLVDHLDDGTKRALFYSTANDTFNDFTALLFPDFTLLEFEKTKWTSYGYPLEPPLSYNDYYWKGRDQSNVVKYFVSASLEDQEIQDLRNVSQVDFLYTSLSSDSIYYYNYSNTQRGLMRSHIYNQGTKKDFTSVPFTSDFKIKGFRDKIYFGRYNPSSSKIEAMFKNAELNTYAYLSATNGDRIINPLDFEFIDDKIFVISRTDMGDKLMVFDPNGIVAIPEVSNTLQVSVSPNPSLGIFEITMGNDLLNTSDVELVVIDQLGHEYIRTKVEGKSSLLNLTAHPAGLYYVLLSYKRSIIQRIALSKL